jgi:hypothetical protein
VPTSTNAAIFVQRGGPSRDRQIEACRQYCATEQYSVYAIVPPGRPADAVQLVRQRRVSVIVTGFDSKPVQQLAADVDGAGRVEVVHPAPRVVEPPRHKLGTIADLVVRWFRRGKPIKEIAVEIDGNTTDVRAILRKHGEHLPE